MYTYMCIYIYIYAKGISLFSTPNDTAPGAGAIRDLCLVLYDKNNNNDDDNNTTTNNNNNNDRW